MERRPPPLANIITLGVQNFDAQRDFYRRLGWPQACVMNTGPRGPGT
jgi:hypothetical protein